MHIFTFTSKSHLECDVIDMYFRSGSSRFTHFKWHILLFKNIRFLRICIQYRTEHAILNVSHLYLSNL